MSIRIMQSSKIDHIFHVNQQQNDVKASVFTSKSKCALVTFAIIGVVGAIIIALGSIQVFGVFGSIAFKALISVGTIKVFIAAGGLILTIVANCKKQNPSSSLENPLSLEPILETKHEGPAYSKLGQAALDFAREKLKNTPDLNVEPLDSVLQPVNQELTQLVSLMSYHYNLFMEALNNHNSDFKEKEVIEASDALLKIAYAVSCLTLEDLPAFISNEERKGNSLTNATVLILENSYQKSTILDCSQAYHWLRGYVFVSKNENEEEVLNIPNEIPQEYSDSFYQMDTIYNEWRALYNDYCNRIRLYVNDDELALASPYHFAWTEEDLEPSTFKSTPK